MMTVTPPPAATLRGLVDWRVFLTEHAPPVRANATDVFRTSFTTPETPELKLFCGGPCQSVWYCGGKILQVGVYFPHLPDEIAMDVLLQYECKECGTWVKTYALRILGDQNMRLSCSTTDVVKLAEWPTFSFTVPAKVDTLFGFNRDLFFKGNDCERQGLGVGASAYYRRIVELQKNLLLDEIIKVAERTNAPPDAIKTLRDAKNEQQFKKAVTMVKDAVPESLFIKGHNPLTLLHNALSQNIHNASDEECLALAQAIRTMLFALAERLNQALQNETELHKALSVLLKPRP